MNSGPGTPGVSQAMSQIEEDEEDELDLNPIDDTDLVEPTTQREVSPRSTAARLDSQTDDFQSQTTTKVVPLKRAHSASFQSNKSKRTVQDAFNRIATVYESKMADKPANNQPTPRVLAIRTLDAEYGQLNDTRFNQAIELLAVDANVEVFNALSGKRRDGWLRAKVNAKEDDEFSVD
jgi:hypothetical protein